MSRDPKLRLVRPEETTAAAEGAADRDDRGDDELRAASGQGELDTADHEALLALTLGEDAAEFSAEERERATALAASLEALGPPAPGTEPTGSLERLDAELRPLAELAEALRAAGAPQSLDELDHELLLALSVGEQGSEPSELDLERAEGLAEGLEAVLGLGARPASGRQAQEVLGRLAVDLPPLVELAQALQAATGQAELDELSNERALQRALRGRAAGRGASSRVTWLGSVAAIAAGVALFLGTLSLLEPGGDAPIGRQIEPSPRPTPELIRSRSTQTLFDPATPFARRGGESARVDKIARARAADLRANRFAQWGVR